MFSDFRDIERQNGYLDLDQYFLDTYNEMNLKILIRRGIVKENNYKLYEFKTEKANYYFKLSTHEEAIKELLANKMLDFVGYEHVDYDMAKFNGMYGVITKDFKKENCEYYSGDNLIEENYRYIDPKAKKINYLKYNNLEAIWDLLEVKYGQNPNKKNIIKNVMQKISEKFLFDIIINQSDGDSHNWMIEENESFTTLAPIYDNQKMLKSEEINDEYNTNIKVNETDEEYNNKKQLELFLSYSSSYFRHEFERLMNYLTPGSVKYMFNDIEALIDFKIDNKIKNRILSLYACNYNELLNILANENTIKR